MPHLTFFCGGFWYCKYCGRVLPSEPATSIRDHLRTHEPKGE